MFLPAKEKIQGGGWHCARPSRQAFQASATRTRALSLFGEESLGCALRRQAPLGPYIVDFVCFERKLVLEVDGGQHLESVGDKFRDPWLEAEGFRVLRFWNPEVLNDVEAVLAAISAAVQRLRCPASP